MWFSGGLAWHVIFMASRQVILAAVDILHLLISCWMHCCEIWCRLPCPTEEGTKALNFVGQEQYIFSCPVREKFGWYFGQQHGRHVTFFHFFSSWQSICSPSRYFLFCLSQSTKGEEEEKPLMERETGVFTAVDCPCLQARMHIFTPANGSAAHRPNVHSTACMHAFMCIDTYTQAVDGNPIWQACIPVEISKTAKANGWTLHLEI